MYHFDILLGAILAYTAKHMKAHQNQRKKIFLPKKTQRGLDLVFFWGQIFDPQVFIDSEPP